MDIPADMAALPVNHPTVIERCVSDSAQRFRIHPLVIRTIMAVEGGKPGTVSKNTNGTVDMGIMQINSVNLPEIRKTFPGVTREHIVHNPCINIGVASWMLAGRIRAAGSLWLGVGNYHSKTPSVRARYMKKIKRAYRGLLQQSLKRGHS